MSEFEFILCAALIVLLVMVATSVIRHVGTKRELDEWIKRCSIWENEYWILRNSDAVNRDEYHINLSWSKYGDDNIRKRHRSEL